MTIRNLPPTLSTAIDRIRTFRVSETRYDAMTNTLTVIPESPTPRVEIMLARQAVGAVSMPSWASQGGGIRTIGPRWAV